MDSELDEDDAKFCSACLAVDVQLILLHKSGYFEAFASISRISAMDHQCSPQYVCYICLALLKRCAKFRSMCHKAQQLLNRIRADCGVIKNKHILKLPHPKLTVNYSQTPLELVTYPPESHNLLPEVKIEDPGELDQDYGHFDAEDYENNDQENSIDIKMFVEKVQTGNLHIVKVMDESGPDKAIDESAYDPDLDKPLAVLKTDMMEKLLRDKKRKLVKKSVKKVKKKEIKEEVKPLPRRRKAKFNKYNEKFEKDFEEFCKAHNVEVVFLTKEQQIERMKLKYSDNKYRLRCELCFAGFMTDTAYEKHVKGHDPSSGPYICEICQSRYKEKAGLQRHVRLHKKEFVCKLCCKTLANSHLAMQHHRWHEGFKHECKHCKKKFNAMSSHLNHVREHHTEVRCKDCGEVFEGTIRLKRHRNTSHCEVWAVDTYTHTSHCECKECHSVFRNARVLTKHAEAGCRPDQHPCLLCGAALADEAGLRAHQRDQHDYRGTTRFKCEACPSTYSTDRARGAHWASVHMGHQYVRNRGKRDRAKGPAGAEAGAAAGAGAGDSGRVYLCELCAKSFKSIINLKQHHTNVHLSDRRFKCSVCPKAFPSKCKLAVHINVHTGDRPFQCKMCPERFKSYSQRYKHRLLVHEKDRPYKCSECEKDYVLLYDLKAHIRYAHLHHPRPPRKNPRRPRSQKT